MVTLTSGMKRLSTDFGNGNVRIAAGHSARWSALRRHRLGARVFPAGELGAEDRGL
jgi:hypothetical protein